jgi:K+ transporter
MLFWFVTLGVGGLVQILQGPEVLAALDPRRAHGAIAHGGPRTAFLLAGVVLGVTGVEALYADMGPACRPLIDINQAVQVSSFAVEGAFVVHAKVTCPARI